jgi:osmoprotectant transport system ATP-binding protein
VVLADRIAVMREGAHVVQYDAPEVLLARPSDADVAAFVGATRGLKLLSLRSATDVPATAVGPEGIAGWHVRTDAAGRPATWAHRTGELPEPAVETVGPDGSMRDLLDSALASPARAAVRVDAAGALVGTVPFSVLAAFLSETETPLAVEPVP